MKNVIKIGLIAASLVATSMSFAADSIQVKKNTKKAIAVCFSSGNPTWSSQAITVKPGQLIGTTVQLDKLGNSTTAITVFPFAASAYKVSCSSDTKRGDDWSKASLSFDKGATFYKGIFDYSTGENANFNYNCGNGNFTNSETACAQAGSGPTVLNVS